MAPVTRAERFSPELRASLFHFTVFGTTGVASAYLAIWLRDKGMTPGEVGIINAVPVLLTLLGSVTIGQLADRARDWRTAIILLAVFCGVAPLGLYVAEGFWGLLLVIALSNFPAAALVSIVDTATLRMTQRRGTDFGSIRAWGTIGYMATAALGGAVIGWLGAVAFVPLFLGLALMRMGVAFGLPRFRGADWKGPTAKMPKARTGNSLTGLLRPWFILPCVAFALIQSSHLLIGTLGSLIWSADGIEAGWFGPLIAIGAAGEAVVMFFWRRIGPTMSARTMLIIAGLVATARWTATAFEPSLPLLFGLQLLHAVTFPFAYFGLMQFVANWTPEKFAAEAQGFAQALSMAVGVVSLAAFGWLVGQIGGKAFFVAAVLTLAGAGAAWLSLLLRPVHGQAELPD